MPDPLCHLADPQQRHAPGGGPDRLGLLVGGDCGGAGDFRQRGVIPEMEGVRKGGVSDMERFALRHRRAVGAGIGLRSEDGKRRALRGRGGQQERD